MRTFLANSVKGDGTIVAVLSDGSSYTADSTHSNYRNISQALIDNDAEAFVEAANTTRALEDYVAGPSHINTTVGNVSVVGGEIFYGKERLRSTLVDRIYDMMNKGFHFHNMLKFLDNLYENPSKNSVDQLHSFLENAYLPITDDGCFLAYKTVKRSNKDEFTDEYDNVVTPGDLVDKFTGTVRNNVGDSPWMARNKVADDPNKHCSHGYHVGALAYAGPGGWYNNSDDVVVIVKVNPRDAVSVPNDHSCQKLRTCKYTVVGFYQGELVRPVYSVDEEVEDWEYNNEDYDDLVEDTPDFFEDSYIDINDVWVGDEIVCVYRKLDGTIANRVVEILESNRDSFVVRLLNGDAKYNLDTTNTRTFKHDGMSKIQYLER